MTKNKTPSNFTKGWIEFVDSVVPKVLGKRTDPNDPGYFADDPGGPEYKGESMNEEMTTELEKRAEEFAARQEDEAGNRLMSGIVNPELRGSLFGDHLFDQLRFAYETGEKAANKRIWSWVQLRSDIAPHISKELKRVIFDEQK